MSLSGDLFKKLETLAESSTEIEINKTSAVQCYDQLINGKTTDEPLSTAAKCKMIIHHVLSTFDLVVEKEHEYLLKTDTVLAELTYNHIMLEFKERFTFHLVFSHFDDGFNVFLKRRRLSIGSSKRARYSEPTYDIEIDSTELPSLLDDDKENDVAKLMKTMGRIILYTFS